MCRSDICNEELFFLRSSPCAPVGIYLPFDVVQGRPVRGAGRGFIAPGLYDEVSGGVLRKR